MTTQDEATEPTPEAPRSQAGGAGGAWIGLGVGLGLLGFGLSVLPALAPATLPWVRSIVGNGATPGLVGATGVVVLALGSATRTLARQHRATQAAIGALPSHAAQFERVASDLAQTRGALQELRVESVYLRDGIASLQQGLGEELSSGNRRGLQESVFQLAASLDQTGARLDERLALQHDLLAQSLQTFHDTLLTACLRIDELHGRLPSATDGAPSAFTGGGPDSLGVLDLISDEPPVAPIRTPDAVLSGPVETRKDPRAALPAPIVADPALASTIAHLQGLFADARVQQALAHMQQHGQR